MAKQLTKKQMEANRRSDEIERAYFVSQGLEPPGPPETGEIDLTRALGTPLQKNP